jgi:hypothetical protein
MRTENIKVKLTIPIPIDKPDKNGVVYTERAIEKAVCALNTNLPIIYRDNRKEDVIDNSIVIGHTTGSCHMVHWDFENQVCNLVVDGQIYFGGTSCIVNDIQDNVVKDFRITSIGIGVE